MDLSTGTLLGQLIGLVLLFGLGALGVGALVVAVRSLARGSRALERIADALEQRSDR